MAEVQQVTKKARIVTIAEAKEILSKVDPEKADQIQKRTIDYLSKFTKVDTGKARKMQSSLVEHTGLTVDEATELVNIMPKSQEELRVFTAGWRKLIPTATVDKILKILTET
ncbi:MAG TPA: RNA polymerase Rpb4 [Nitrososphaerales archaeon]|nr:RNA polymerase Rpb4 [Nitrososphaerales archaeon]